MKKIMKKLRDQGAFSLVEVIVAVAVLAVVTIPIMSAFVMTSRLNYKGRVKEQALTVAQNVVEGVKALGIQKTLEQCDASSSSFEIVPENSGSTKISHSIVSSVLKQSTIVITNYELMSSKKITNTSGGDVTVTVDCYEYKMKISNILMGKTYYDATIIITPNYSTDYVVSYYYLKNFKDAGMSNLKYFDVRVDVTRHNETDVLNTYYGTFVDQNK